MISDKVAIVAANRLVAELDKRDISAYVTLAKAALWGVGIAMVLVMSVAVVTWNLPVVCQAGQVLVMLAVSVLGFHSYKGSRILHILRNWHNKETP